jgi:hypothetical protein
MGKETRLFYKKLKAVHDISKSRLANDNTGLNRKLLQRVIKQKAAIALIIIENYRQDALPQDKSISSLSRCLDNLDKAFLTKLNRFFSDKCIRESAFNGKNTILVPFTQGERRALIKLYKAQCQRDKKLVKSIFNKRLDYEGFSFFGAKIPAHVKALRKVFDNRKIVYPLSEELRKELFEIVYDAKHKSFQCLGLRSNQTETLYDNLMRSLPG